MGRGLQRQQAGVHCPLSTWVVLAAIRTVTIMAPRKKRKTLATRAHQHRVTRAAFNLISSENMPSSSPVILTVVVSFDGDVVAIVASFRYPLRR